MAILTTELKYYLSAEVSAVSTNGGRISANEAVNGDPNNLWPDVLKPERDAGSNLYRKVFFKVTSDNNDKFAGCYLWNEIPTPADDYVVMFAGTDTDTQATLSESKIYGAGMLKTTVAAGAGVVVVTLEDGAMAGIFSDGDVIRITDKSSPSSGTGNEEFATISGAPVVVGDEVTITLAGALANGYASGSSKVQSVYDAGDVQALAGTVTVTSASGTYDDTSYPIDGNNDGTVAETITITLAAAGDPSTSLAFTAVGSVSGALSGGTTNVDWTPQSGGKDLCTVLAAGFGGTYAVGDTIEIPMSAATVPFWLKRIIPSASDYLAANYNTTYAYGQSA